MNNSPIFIHSLFRSGSTYLFKVFRREEAHYWCYQEPENEFLLKLNTDPDTLLDIAGETGRMLRHPTLSKPYFWEFHQIGTALSGLFRKSFSYDDFFVDRDGELDPAQYRYFEALIANAKARPVLQFCRSTGRVASLKAAFGGIHIYLWRDPRTQWWSFKLNDYFDPMVHLIYNAKALPPVLADIKCQCNISTFHDDDLDREFRYSHSHPTNAVSNYRAFFALWLHSFLAGKEYTDLMIGIDQLSRDPTYAADIRRQLAAVADVHHIDLSDCSVPLIVFDEGETLFYRNIEDQVRETFIAHEYDNDMIAFACQQSEQSRNHPNSSPDFARDAKRARQITLRYLDRLADAEHNARSAENRVVDMERRATAAERNANDAVALAIEEQEHSSKLGARATEAEAHANTLRQEFDLVATANHHHWLLSEARAKELAIIYKSRSWRITAPLRWLTHALRSRHTGFPINPVTSTVQAISLRIMTRPRLRRFAKSALNRFPLLKDRLAKLAYINAPRVAEHSSLELVFLTPRAKLFYAELQAAIFSQSPGDY